MSFIGRIQKFAHSPEGKKVIKEAQDLARDPHTKERIEEARKRLMHKGKPAAETKPKAGGSRSGA